MQDFEVIPHTADLTIRVVGSTLQQLFEHALIAMFQVMGPKSSFCYRQDERILCSSLTQSRKIEIQSPDPEALLVDFLSYALYLSDVHNEAYFAVAIHDYSTTSIVATIYGVPVTGFDIEIKAVTYHNLALVCVDGQWQTKIVFDI